jgi:hypothetical protein
MPSPAPKFEKTGIPIAPRRRYTKKAEVPLFPPKTKRVKNTAKVCRVKGMTVGMEIQEQIASKMEKMAVYTKS